MNLLSDIITYVRRIIKSPSDAEISDNLIIDYINRFWIMDVDARIQVFDLKTKYQFLTTPGVDKYNMPLYDVQTEPGNQTIASYPVYQGFLGPATINGIPVSFETQQQIFNNNWGNVFQNQQSIIQGNGGPGPYTISFPILPNSVSPLPLNPPYNSLLRGHVDISGIIALGGNIDPPVYTSDEAIGPLGSEGTIESCPVTSVFPALYITTFAADGSNLIVSDSGQFLEGNVNYGLLMSPGKAPYGNRPLTSGGYSITSNTVNYQTGTATVTFPVNVPVGMNINAQCSFFSAGLPRAILFYNNVITLRSPPAQQYLVELEAYLSPAAFLSTAAAVPFGYMSEYLARGAARKILSDTGDIEQFMFYEPLFKEQETLVWKRSQRQFTSTRTETIYSQGIGGYNSNNFWNGGLGI